MVWMDFVSWHQGPEKYEDLVLTIQYRDVEDGNIHTKWVDIPCRDKETNAHNYFFFFQGWKVLLENVPCMRMGNNFRFKKIYRLSDNGRPFMTRQSCFIESYFQAKYGVTIEVIALCPHHAWSLCDSHDCHGFEKMGDIVGISQVGSIQYVKGDVGDGGSSFDSSAYGCSLRLQSTTCPPAIDERSNLELP